MIAIKDALFTGWWYGQRLLGCADPFITFVDEHHRDVITDRVLPITILADQPGFPVIFQKTILLADAVWAT